jgi:hypothetical protein
VFKETKSAKYMKSKLFIFENPLAPLAKAWYNTASSVAVVLGSLE